MVTGVVRVMTGAVLVPTPLGLLLCHSQVGLALILIIGVPFYRDEKIPEDLTALRAVGDR
jgi:hypothetical protein